MNKEQQKLRSRDLRKNMTDAERKLWTTLSHNQLGVRFRRQFPLGPYIVDFVCFNPRLIIECDVGQHHTEQKNYDQKRDLFLRNQGFQVLRFWNSEILENLGGVYEVILRVIRGSGSPPPYPPPPGRR
jgi:very-short-patch-repair endonuclease